MKASLQLLLLLALVSFPLMRSAYAHDTSKTAETLRDFQTSLAETKLEAERLDAFSLSHSGVSWRTHADQLNHLAEHVNGLGQILKDLEGLRPEASSIHSQAITDARPPLERIATNLTAAINMLSDDRGAIKTSEYRELTNNIWSDADGLHAAIGNVNE